MLAPPIAADTILDRLREMAMDAVDDVADGADRLEFGGRDLPPGIALQLHHQLDGIDAVELQILEQPRRRRHLVGRRLEQLLEIEAQGREDLVLADHQAMPLWAATKRAMLATF